ncbi:DegV family protein with EDD domain [Bacillus oleivorans]|uniref:DegV family protein with EDD domain n=1 Tax=Bacillus oleivorans TaxID=1448271 RepID=A0A285CMI4_9BACI|nr:DegV family protein [Bacillus oleivorans]SNX68246.1 DegV family protein with EDD domain [Bacillus oleivorans]
MKKIAWVTDSTAFLDEELKKDPDLYVLPMTIYMDEKEYQDGIDLTPEQFYAMLETTSTIPKTSQPSVGVFQNLYEQLSQSYDAIISIHISEKLSGTVSSSRQAAQLTSIPVYTIDSEILTYPLTRLIKYGKDLLANGHELEEAVAKINDMKKYGDTYVIVGSLEQLHRSGRLKGLSFYLGSILDVKPIIQIKDGALQIKEKVRGAKKAKQALTHYLKAAYEQNPIEEAYIFYGLDDSEASLWIKTLSELFPKTTFSAYPLGAVIGVHAGKDTLGISWFAQYEY